MLIDSKCISRILPKLSCSEAFYLPEHQIIYDALIKLYFNSIPIDAISLRAELKEQGKLEEIGGVEYIAKMMQSVPHSANASYYASIVLSKQKERQVVSAVYEIAGTLDEFGSADESIQKIQDIALELEPAKTGPDFVELKNVVTQVATDMRDDKTVIIPTGFEDLDRKIFGFCPGDFVIIAGRPSMGKSALALDMSLSMAKVGISVFFASLEMKDRPLIERALSGRACVDLTKVRSGTATDDEWSEIYKQALELKEVSLLVSGITYTPEQLAGMVHRLKQTHNIGVVFVDYIQLMTIGRRMESRQQEVTEISRKLKAIAQRENIPVIALSQLNRQVDSRTDHRPRMSDLRESGSLEQDADLVLFVYRDDYYHKDEPGFKPTGKAEIIVSKSRQGPTGIVELVFVHDYAKFSNVTRGYGELQYD